MVGTSCQANLAARDIEMAHPRIIWPVGRWRRLALTLAAVGFTMLATSEWQAAAQDAQQPKPGDIQGLLTRYQADRSFADSIGWLKKFSPELTEQADALAQRGEKALAG